MGNLDSKLEFDTQEREEIVGFLKERFSDKVRWSSRFYQKRKELSVTSDHGLEILFWKKDSKRYKVECFLDVEPSVAFRTFQDINFHSDAIAGTYQDAFEGALLGVFNYAKEFFEAAVDMLGCLEVTMESLASYEYRVDT